MEISARLLGFTAYGVQWVLWLLIFLSVISIGMMLERWWYFATYRPSAQVLARQIRALLHSGPPLVADRDEALHGAVEGAKVRQRLQLERNLAFLGTLGSNAPFIGLFGTVLGIIKAFHDLAGNQAGGPAVVMSGISEALVATAVGLMVAIPAVVAFNYFNRRVRTSMTQVDWMAHLALAEVKADSGESAPAEGVRPALVPSALPVSPRRFLLIAAVGGFLLFATGLLVGRSTNRGVRPVLSASPTEMLQTLETPRTPPTAGEMPPARVSATSPDGNRLITPGPVPPITAAPAPLATAPVPIAPVPIAPVPIAPVPIATGGETAAGKTPVSQAPVKSKPTKQWKGKKRRPPGAAPTGAESPGGHLAGPSAGKPEQEQPKNPAPTKTEEPAAPAQGVP